MAWFLDQDKDIMSEKLKLKDGIAMKNKLGVSQCPGKKLDKGRDGKSYNRDIFLDIAMYAAMGISKILCLLNDSELRHLGLQVKDYKAACEKQGVEFYQYPIIEMAPPDDLAAFKRDVVDVIIQHLIYGNGHVLVHCRGGVGRAGLLACCVLGETS